MLSKPTNSQLWQIVELAEQIQADGVKFPRELQAQVLWLKTYAFYEFSLQRAIRKLYNSGDVFEYIQKHGDLIREQLTRAWREGMREVGMNPDEITSEEVAELERLIRNEEDHVLDFAQGILDARNAGGPINGFLSRASVWANRYNEVKNIAKVMAAKNKKFEWVLGPTEHCRSCVRLSGIVKRGSVWEKAGIRPQNPPNDKLECGGWNCQCELRETDKPAKRGPFPNLP